MSDDDVRFKCAHCDFETSKRSIFELADHVAEEHPDKAFICPDHHPSPPLREHTKHGKDAWQKQPNGDLTCTYCGSMSEETLIDIMEHYVAGDEGYRFDPSTKSYKVYANRPGVRNASEGAIKFYMGHVDGNHPDLDKRTALFAHALEKAREEFRKMFPAEAKA